MSRNNNVNKYQHCTDLFICCNNNNNILIKKLPMTFTIYHLAFIWSWLMTYPRDTWHVTAPAPCHHSNHHINEAHCACASRKSSLICIHYRCQACPVRLLSVSTHSYAQYKILGWDLVIARYQRGPCWHLFLETYFVPVYHFFCT